MPNQIAAPNRRFALGLMPWSFGTLISQSSAVGGSLVASKRWRNTYEHFLGRAHFARGRCGAVAGLLQTTARQLNPLPHARKVCTATRGQRTLGSAPGPEAALSR